MEEENTLDLNNYLVISKIGSGAFSEVFKVKDKKTGLYYAAKVLNNSLDQEEKSKVRDIRREVNTMFKINHPAILKFIGFSPIDFKDSDKPVIMTEIMPNGCLRDIIKLERQSTSKQYWNDTKKLINIYGIASAMEYLHKNGIIHRDLKPENILMDDFLCPRIADFGLSKNLKADDNTVDYKSTIGIKGTPAYIAPEIFNSHEYSPECDVYAFGIIVYEILSNNEVYKDCNMYQIISKVTQDIRPEIPDYIPEAYKNLIERCWSQNPSDRPSFSEIVSQLQNNSEFITDLIEQGDYYAYIDYVNSCQKTFDSNKRIPLLDEFMGNKNTHTTIFKKVKIVETLTEPNEKGESIKVREIILNDGSDSPKEIKKLADEGDIFSIKKYAKILNEGDGVPVDKKESAYYYKLAADKGDAESMQEYSQILLNHDGVAPNPKEAAEYCKKAADQNYAKAMFSYSLMLSKGIGVDKDETESFAYMKRAAENGDPDAELKYGNILSTGGSSQTSSINKSEAALYFKKSADHGNSQAAHLYGMMMFLGDGVPVDKTEAARYLLKFAEKGDVSIISLLAPMFVNGDGVSVDLKKAAELYKIASKKGYNKATYEYAKMLNRGLGVEMNKEEAAQNFKIAADRGHPHSMYEYGMMLYKGEGVSMNKIESAKYIKMAATQNVPEAIDQLISVMIKEEGIKRDNDVLIFYLKKSSERGNFESTYHYGLMKFNGEGVEQNKKSGIQLIKQAADNNYVPAMYKYGLLLSNGDGVKKNKKDAAIYYKNASKISRPFKNKLVPQIKSFCTTLEMEQKMYFCKTCNITKENPICGICAQHCHKGHEITFSENAHKFACNCSSHGDCKCQRKVDENAVCTFVPLCGFPIEQPMFHCITCGILDELFICQDCAKCCHEGHDLIYCGILKKICHCFIHLNSFCQISHRQAICSSFYYGSKSVEQRAFGCDTCTLTKNSFVCPKCANCCHKDHLVNNKGIKNISCACPNCKCRSFPNKSYLNRCTLFNSKSEIKQRMYVCYTCGIVEPFAFCEACAINCHINHVIEYVGIGNFTCSCQSFSRCMMRFVPMLHNNRIECDRKVLGIDDASACYVCLTCDKSMNQKICETCAIKNHLNHDIHLLGYMKFNCCEGEKKRNE